MSKSLSKSEKVVLYDMVSSPVSTDRDISERTGIKLSTVTAIRRRLMEKKMFYTVRIPCLQTLGAEMLAVNYSVYKATAPVEHRLKVGKKFAGEHRELFWAINEYVQSVGIHFSQNYTDIRKNIADLERYYTDHGYLDEEGINLLLFPFDITAIHFFFDFAPLLRQSFKISDKPASKENGRSFNLCFGPGTKTEHRSMTDSAKLVYYNLIRHPQLTDTEISEITQVSQRTVTKLRKSFEKERMLKTINVPNLEALGFKMLVFDHARLNLKIHEEQRERILENLIGIKPPLLFMVGSSDVVALTAYEDFETYRRCINNFAEVYKHDNIFVKEPTRIMFSLTELYVLKDHIYAPMVAKILELEE